MSLIGNSSNPSAGTHWWPRPAIIAAMVLLLVFPALGLSIRFQAEAGPSFALTAEERGWLDQNPEKLTLFFNTEFPPIEFISETGEFVGMGADVIDMVEKRLGINFIKSPCPDWNRHLAALESGECAVAPTIVRTIERESYAFFTVPYATVPVVIISTRSFGAEAGLKDLKGLRVGVVSGYATEKYVRDRAMGGFEVVTVQNVPEGLRAVSFGQLDAMVENLAVAAYYISEEGIPNLRAAGRTDYAFAWSIGVSRKYPLLYSAIRKAMDDIPESELEIVRKRWITLDADLGIDPETLGLLKLVAVFAVLLLLSLTGITFFLKHRLKEKVTGLQESEMKFRAVFDGSQDAITIFTTEGKLLDCNPAALELYGLDSKDDFINVRPADFSPPFQPDGRKSYDASREKIAEATETGGFVAFEWLHKRKTGETFPAEVILTSYRLGEKHVLQSNVRDITERKNFEAQLHQAQKMEAIGTLAGGVAHDFNNLLQAIRGYTQLLLWTKGGNDAGLHELMEIEKATGRAAALVRQLLAFSRKVEGERRPVNLNREITDIEKVLKRTIPKMIDIEIHLDRDLRPVQADPIQMEQILLNLGSNSADAMPEGGKLIIKTRNASLEKDDCSNHLGAEPGEYVLLSVTDTGHGMDGQTLQHIFEPFFTTKDVGKGTGLGLASVYGIVKSHGGYITCDSETGRGTTFKIYLPAMKHGADRFHEEAEALPLKGGSETILVVDDEPTVRESAVRILDRFGYKGLAVQSGEEALEVYKARAGDIDLVLLDLGMPGMGGHACMRELLILDPSALVIIASGYALDPGIKEVLESGAAGYVGKPYQVTDLLTKVRAVLDGAAADKGPPVKDPSVPLDKP